MARTFLSGIALNGQRAQSVGDPTASTDAATRGWVEGQRSDVVMTERPGANQGGINIGANTARYVLVQSGGSLANVGLRVSGSAGNCSVGAFTGSGTGRSRVPATLLAASASAACPALGWATIALGATVTVNAWRDFLAWWQTTSASVWVIGTNEDTAGFGDGFCWQEARTVALSGTIGSLSGRTRPPILLGTP